MCNAADIRLPAEAANDPGLPKLVPDPVRPAGDALALPSLALRDREQAFLRNRLQQSEPDDLRRDPGDTMTAESMAP